jgi:nucleoside-diphosphate-sugar epimerase
MLAFLGNKFSIKTNLCNIVSKTIGRTTLQKMVMQAISRERYPLGQQEPSLSDSSIPKIPELWLEKTFTSPFHFPIDKANRILGFKPSISLDEGMETIHKWLLEYVSRSGFESDKSFFGSFIPTFAPLISRRP